MTGPSIAEAVAQAWQRVLVEGRPTADGMRWRVETWSPPARAFIAENEFADVALARACAARLATERTLCVLGLPRWQARILSCQHTHGPIASRVRAALAAVESTP